MEKKQSKIINYDIFYHAAPSKTIQEIQNNATQITTKLKSVIKEIDNNNRQQPPENITVLSFSFSPSMNAALVYSQALIKSNEQNITQYSLLGMTTLLSEKTFLSKKDIINELINLKFKPTPKDKEFALLEKWIRCESTRKKIYLFSYAHHNQTSIVSLIPRDLVKLIILITFNTEESLFDGLT